jgi:hypothetical protein
MFAKDPKSSPITFVSDAGDVDGLFLILELIDR